MPTTHQKQKITCRVCGAIFYPEQKWQIDEEKLLLAEGVDVHRFLIYACKTYGKTDVQVINFGGITELNLFLKTLVIMGDFSKVKTVVIARDAETNVTSAIDSVKSAFNNADLPIPPMPFEYSSVNSVKTAFMLFPGPDQHDQCQKGTLEHLCLATVDGDPLLKCVDTFLKCAHENQENNDKLRQPWKSKLYAYLAGKDSHAGKRLSQAAKDKVWDWNHSAMTPFKKIIQDM